MPIADRRSSFVTLRRKVLLWIGAASLAAAAGCAGPTAHAERVSEYPLEQSKSYAWVTDDLVLIQLGDDQPNVRTKENEQRLRAAIDRALAARGLELGGRETADVLVAFSVGTTMRYRVEGGPAEGTSLGAGEPGEKQTKGTLNIYIIDRAQMKEVWHGWTSKWLSKSDDPETIIEQAVSTVMAAYPNAK